MHAVCDEHGSHRSDLMGGRTNLARTHACAHMDLCLYMYMYVHTIVAWHARTRTERAHIFIRSRALTPSRSLSCSLSFHSLSQTSVACMSVWRRTIAGKLEHDSDPEDVVVQGRCSRADVHIYLCLFAYTTIHVYLWNTCNHIYSNSWQYFWLLCTWYHIDICICLYTSTYLLTWIQVIHIYVYKFSYCCILYYVYLSINLSNVCVYIYIYIYMCIYVYIRVLCTCIYLYVHMYESIYDIFTYRSVHRSIDRSIYLSIIYLSIYLANLYPSRR